MPSGVASWMSIGSKICWYVWMHSEKSSLEQSAVLLRIIKIWAVREEGRQKQHPNHTRKQLSEHGKALPLSLILSPHSVCTRFLSLSLTAVALHSN